MVKKSICILSMATILLGDTTMCFKKDWIDPSTIENVQLDGGKCMGEKTLSQMKKDGWVIDDIKMTSSKNGMNYMYVLKKGDNKVSDKNLKEKLIILEKEKAKKEELDKNKEDIAQGKKIYESTCIRCHGVKAEVKAYNTARALNTLTLQEIETSLWQYNFDEKDNGMAILMKPYADSLNSEMTEQVYKYIQTFK